MAKIIRILSTLFFLVNTLSWAQGDDWKMTHKLSGKWKFSLGDNQDWISPDYDDQNWEQIRVPAKWENEGFYGYDGFAWYRTTFHGSKLKPNAHYMLSLGYIDDVDEVYINGHLIGSSGRFPPDLYSAYKAYRLYTIPKKLIAYNGVNHISVRVYDSHHSGGIVAGEIGIFTNERDNASIVNLRGIWDIKLETSQHLIDKINQAKELTTKDISTFETRDWSAINVPGRWEDQGFKHYDGYAWYRKKIEIPSNAKDEDLVVVLGKIDDTDRTFFNGKLIGSTQWYNNLRIYNIPRDLIKYGQDNELTILIYDDHGAGGITHGPVGILKQKDLTKYMRYR